MNVRLVVAALLVGLAPAFAFAQGSAFPNKGVTLVVPVAPGGILDTVARMLAADMSKHLGQPVVVDNKPGASGATHASGRVCSSAAHHACTPGRCAAKLHTLHAVPSMLRRCPFRAASCR